MLGAQDTHTVTITDADAASVEFALASSTTGENGGAHNVTVNLVIPAGVTLQDAATFSVAAVDLDTTAADYTLNTTSITFAAGSGKRPWREHATVAHHSSLPAGRAERLTSVEPTRPTSSEGVTVP